MVADELSPALGLTLPNKDKRKYCVVTHDELKRSALQNPEVQTAYQALESKFVLLRQTIWASKTKKPSQAEVPQTVPRL
jgi:hypothetical protein